MQKQELKDKTIHALAWKGVEQFGLTSIQFVVAIVLARLIAPEAFGVIALIQVCISLCQPFIDGGFGMSLIQRKIIDDIDCCSVFWLNIVTALMLYCLIFVVAPIIAQFYNSQTLLWPLRVMTISLIISSFTIVHRAQLSRKLDFHKQCLISFATMFANCGISVGIALKYPNVWALVAGQLSAELVRCIVTYKLILWHPKLIFDWKRIGRLFSFGAFLLMNSFISSLSNNVAVLLVGKRFSASAVAFYTRGRTYAELLTTTIDGTMSNVLFPVFSRQQNSIADMLQSCRRGLQLSFFCTFPALALFFVVSKPFIRLLLTDKWLPSVPFLQITCFACLTWVVQGIMQQCINAIGKSALVFTIKSIFIFFNILVLFIFARYGIIIMLIATAFLNYVSMFVYIFLMRYYFDYKIRIFIADVGKSFVGGIIAAIAAEFALKFILDDLNDFFKLVITTIIMSLGYLASALILRNPLPQEIIGNIGVLCPPLAKIIIRTTNK